MCNKYFKYLKRKIIKLTRQLQDQNYFFILIKTLLYSGSSMLFVFIWSRDCIRGIKEIIDILSNIVAKKINKI